MTCQGLTDLALAALQWYLCLIFLNYVVNFTFDSGYIDHLSKVLMQIAVARLKLKHSKPVFFAQKVSFLGHTLSDKSTAILRHCNQDSLLANPQKYL